MKKQGIGASREWAKGMLLDSIHQIERRVQ